MPTTGLLRNGLCGAPSKPPRTEPLPIPPPGFGPRRFLLPPEFSRNQSPLPLLPHTLLWNRTLWMTRSSRPRRNRPRALTGRGRSYGTADPLDHPRDRQRRLVGGAGPRERYKEGFPRRIHVGVGLAPPPRVPPESEPELSGSHSTACDQNVKESRLSAPPVKLLGFLLCASFKQPHRHDCCYLDHGFRYLSPTTSISVSFDDKRCASLPPGFRMGFNVYHL